jgi:alpha-tubulin suppressor-like RCC1 family protein
MSWGMNSSGQLGLGHTEKASSPQTIEHLRGKNITAVFAGGDYSFALAASKHLGF